MDERKMVLRCLETFQAGYDVDTRLVEINWLPWDKERTSEIRCLFWADMLGFVRCCVHSSLSRTHGADLDTGRTWELPD